VTVSVRGSRPFLSHKDIIISGLLAGYVDDVATNHKISVIKCRSL
jgi:hypothetical protein